MVAVPPAYLERTGLGPRASVAWEIDGDTLVIRPEKTPPRYRLRDLLSDCDPDSTLPDPDLAWTGGRPQGDELI